VPTIEARDVSYAVANRKLLDGIDIDIDSGQVVGIIGPNGAGKSTLLAMLAGDLRGSGQLRIGGEDLSAMRPVALARQRAVLPQQTVVQFPFTGRQIVNMGRYPHHSEAANSADDDHAAVEAALVATDTADFADRVFPTLSGGEQARVTIARVLAQEAPIMFLDEPTSALDVGHEEKIMTSLVALAKAGRLVVAAFHDLNVAAAHASRLAIIDGGRIVADGSPDEVLTSERLSEIWKQPMTVMRHPNRDCPLVLVP